MSNLYGLSDVVFAERDPAVIAGAIVSGFETAYQEATGEKISLARADPRRLFLLTIADVIALQRNLIDYTGKQNLLAYAEGDKLEHLGLLVGVRRLPAQQARTTLRFTLSTARPSASVIPAGTRVTPGDGNVYFATESVLEIPAGSLAGDVIAAAIESGEGANGFLPGQVNRLVDPLPYVQSVVNATASEGGADVEDDENLRGRIQLAPESFSVAGPEGAYVFWAKSVSQLIGDVKVESRTPGTVEVYPLLKSGDIPGPEILELIDSALSRDDVRPTSDHVRVLKPEVEAYQLDVTWYLSRENITAAGVIINAVEKAVDEWERWQKAALGRDINPSELTRRMVSAGAKRVEIASPQFTPLEPWKVGVMTLRTVSYGGIEDA